MSGGSCGLMGCGDEDDRVFGASDYEGATARWCPGCGDHAVLASVQRLLEAEQLAPERTVFVSGIGCSSRFPHYLKTYGFHGLHGRALPVATGVKLSRPELDVFAVMGDGDCCSIGAGHWIHAIRYNLDIVALLLDNNIYGLTKNQTSPTTPQGHPSHTQPHGSFLPALDPLSTTLGVTNASFVAQTADWAPAHLYATLRAAYRHKGFAFVRVLQRCPVWTPGVFMDAMRNADRVEVLVHPDGIDDEEIRASFPRRREHDPSDLGAARTLALPDGAVRLGLFYRSASAPRYEEIRSVPRLVPQEKVRRLEEELARHAV